MTDAVPAEPTAPSPAAANPLGRAMDTIRALRRQLDAGRRSHRVAIVGIGLRAPGDIHTLEEFWAALDAGRDLTGELPAERRRLFGSMWDGLPSRGGYLDHVLDFDPAFFAIAPRDARAMDPQHRLLLEVVWEAFENAAVLPATDAESTGVFVGITGQDYRRWEAEEPNSYWTAGNGHSFAAGRIAHTLGLGGPTMAIDTACSSSLVAIHNACRSLSARECKVAVAAGVNLVLAPQSTAEIAKTGALSPDGRCRPFDARANGFVRGEGAGALILKRLADAEADGDRVLAVIEGSALNHDGRSSGFTAPNVLAQIRLTSQVLTAIGISPADIGYLETHGTGTSLGDPIELEAVATALGRVNGGAPLQLGSIKANLGHAEAAAGVLGLIKAVLCLQEQHIPPQAQFDTLNPRIDLSGTAMTIADRSQPWPVGAGRYAAVSSFGMSGTNAQVVLSAGRPAEAELAGTGEFILSARTPDALRELARAYAQRCTELKPSDYPAFCHTVTFGRTRQREASAITAPDPAAAAAALTAIADGRTDVRVRPAEAEPTRSPRAVLTVPNYPWQRSTHAIR